MGNQCSRTARSTQAVISTDALTVWLGERICRITSFEPTSPIGYRDPTTRTTLVRPNHLIHIQIDPGPTLEIPSSQLGHTQPQIDSGGDFPYCFFFLLTTLRRRVSIRATEKKGSFIKSHGVRFFCWGWAFKAGCFFPSLLSDFFCFPTTAGLSASDSDLGNLSMSVRRAAR